MKLLYSNKSESINQSINLSLCLSFSVTQRRRCVTEREGPELDYHTPDYLTRVTRPNWLARTEMVVTQTAIQ